MRILSLRIFLTALLINFLYLSIGNNPTYTCRYQTNNSSEFLLKISSKYYKIFGNDYKNALNYFKKYKTFSRNILKKNNIDAEIIIPILFPERIRYSIVRDFFETAFLEAIYTSQGSDYIDFSIGDFQMKPSFIEKLEKQIKNNKMLFSKYSNLLIKKETEKEARKERIRRLKQMKYQLHYISAFYDIVKIKFDLSNKTKLEKIKFYAAAYNHGFNTTKKDIENHTEVKYFPYGTSYPGKQYSYCDVSADFYKNFYFKIFSN